MFFQSMKTSLVYSGLRLMAEDLTNLIEKKSSLLITQIKMVFPAVLLLIFWRIMMEICGLVQLKEYLNLILKLKLLEIMT